MLKSRQQKKYLEEIRPNWLKKNPDLNYMQVPKLQKIVISMGIAAATKEKDALTQHMNELAALSGQKPVVILSKKAISNFKLREKQPIGLMVTLRGKRMYDFLDRFCNIVSPRIRDFRGFSLKGDGRGNYNIGIDDQQVFPEINLDKVQRTQGMNIAFVTSAKTNEDCEKLLRDFGFPFKK